ncbi:MAG: penicillin-binding transpeptidase domain-containing protein [Hymenobacter sp.]
MATYPPGSVFKLVNELVALQLGVVTPQHRLSRATRSWCTAPTATSTRAT